MDLNSILPWFVAANTIIALATALYALLTSGAKQAQSELASFRTDTADLFKTAAKTMEGLDRRVQVLESELKHLPDAKAFSDLRLSIAEMAGKVGRIEESQLASTRSIGRIENYMDRVTAAATSGST